MQIYLQLSEPLPSIINILYFYSVRRPLYFYRISFYFRRSFICVARCLG